MPWNGTGGFTRLFSWVAQKNAGINIIASEMDDDTDDITTNGFNNTLTRDGQGSASADLPMNGFKHSGVGNATARDQYAVVGQVQGNSYLFATGAGTGNAITAVFSPAITSLTDGMIVTLRAPGANSITNPTFSPNGLTARTITKNGGAALTTNAEYSSGQPIALQYRSAGPTWDLVIGAGLPAIPPSRVLGNATGSTNTPVPITASSVLDFIGATQGDILYRDTSGNGWQILGPGTASQVLQTNGASANPSWADKPARRSQAFTGSGTFTVPANATSATVFKFSVVSGGGGAGSADTTNGAGSGGGGSGAWAVADLSGFAASGSVTVTIGAAGSGGSTSAGGTGGTSKITYSAVDVVSCAGGVGSSRNNGSGGSAGGAAGSATISVGASGLTLASSYSGGMGGRYGGGSSVPTEGGDGGGTPFGQSGRGYIAGGSGGDGGAGTNGGGGGGAFRNGSDQVGGAGGAGFVLVEWVL